MKQGKNFALRPDGTVDVSLTTYKKLNLIAFLTGLVDVEEIKETPSTQKERLDLKKAFDQSPSKFEDLQSFIDQECSKTIFRFEPIASLSLEENLKALYTMTTAARHMRSLFDEFSDACFNRSRRGLLDFIQSNPYIYPGSVPKEFTRHDWLMGVNTPIEAYNQLWLLNLETFESFTEEYVTKVTKLDYLLAFERNGITEAEKTITEALLAYYNRLPVIEEQG